MSAQIHRNQGDYKSLPLPCGSNNPRGLKDTPRRDGGLHGAARGGGGGDLVLEHLGLRIQHADLRCLKQQRRNQPERGKEVRAGEVRTRDRADDGGDVIRQHGFGSTEPAGVVPRGFAQRMPTDQPTPEAK